MPEPGNPQALNRYSYALSNPLKYTDPSGHSVECGLGDLYCKAGKLDVGTRAIDLAKSLGKQKLEYNQITRQQRRILDEGGIVNEFYYEAQQINVGPVRQWLDENLAPGAAMAPNTPNPQLALPSDMAETNAWFVFMWDVGTASITSGGYAMMVMGAVTADLPASAFGYFLTNVASLGATVTLADTIAISGIDSNAYRVSGTTYGLGWSSVASNIPLDLTMAWLQVAYDGYSIDYMYRHPTPSSP